MWNLKDKENVLLRGNLRKYLRLIRKRLLTHSPYFSTLLALLGFLRWEGGGAPGPGRDEVRRQGVSFAEFRWALYGQGKCIER